MARDRMTLAMMIGIPTLQLLLFGYAINPDVRDLPAPPPMAGTAGSRAGAGHVGHRRGPPGGQRAHPQELQALLRAADQGRRAGAAGLRAPSRRARGRMQVLVDGSDTSVQAAARQLAAMPLDAGNPAKVAPRRSACCRSTTRADLGDQRGARPDQGDPDHDHGDVHRDVHRPRARARQPGIADHHAGVQRRADGRQVLPYIAVGLVQVSVIPAAGGAVRGAHPRQPGGRVRRGDAADRRQPDLGCSLSTLAHPVPGHAQMAFFLFLPSILLSGFMFRSTACRGPRSGSRKPLPLTHFMRLIRGVILRGSRAWPTCGSEVVALLGFTAAMMAMATLRFRKRLD